MQYYKPKHDEERDKEKQLREERFNAEQKKRQGKNIKSLEWEAL